MGDDMRAVEAYYRAAAPIGKQKEEIYFASLCMECLWRVEDSPRRRPMEEILRDYYQGDETESMKRRMTSFLDTPWSRDGFLLGKICGIVRMLRAKDASVMPDFDKLADDLVHWNDQDRWVQKRWVRTICRSIETWNQPDQAVNEEMKKNEEEEE